MAIVIVRIKRTPLHERWQAYEVSGAHVVADLTGPAASCHIEVDGEPVPREQWPAKTLAPGCTVTIVGAPTGPVKGIAIAVAKAVAAATTSAALGAGIGASSAILAGTITGSLLGFAVLGGLTVGLQAGLNALLSPQQPTLRNDSFAQSRYYALSAGTNQANRYGPIPVLFGTLRINPPLAAGYYTEVVGNEQYLHALFCLGYGPLQVAGHVVGDGYAKITHATTGVADSAIRIGETALNKYKGVEAEIGTPSQITLYRNDIDEQALSVDMKLMSTSGEGAWFADNIVAIRTTAPDAKTISLDVAFPALATTGADGKLNSPSETQVDFRIQYAPTGSGSYTTVTNAWNIRGATRSPVRRNYTFTVPSPGQYDVRLTRVRSFVGDRELVQMDAVWVALRTIRAAQPFTAANTVVLAMRVRATGQLNGTLDDVSVRATSVLPVWDGSAWADQPTSNPAWAYAHALRGPALNSPINDNRIDADALAEWASACDAQGVAYNWYHTAAETLLQRLRAIAATGRASWALQDGLFTVVQERATVPVQMITQRNSREFSYEKTFRKLPHALRVHYIDDATNQQAERIVFADGYDANTATDYEVIETQGVTSSAQAHKEGRYWLAAATLRPERVTVIMDYENLVAQRGDNVLLSHDVMLVGLAHGRIKSVVTNGEGLATSITIDEPAPMESGKTYGLKIRLANSNILHLPVGTVPGAQAALTLSFPTAGLAQGDLYSFGEFDRETLEMKIIALDYSADLSARVTMLPAAPTILDADTQPIPPFDPLITVPIELRSPVVPRILSALSSSQTLQINRDGSFSPGISLAWALLSDAVSVSNIEVLVSADGLDDHRFLFSAEQQSAVISGLPPDITVIVQVRALSLYGRWSAYSMPATVITVGPTAVPANVEAFGLQILSATQARLTWAVARDVDVRINGRVLIGHTGSATASNWSEAQLIQALPGIASSAEVAYIPGSYMAVFEDAGGRLSLVPAVARSGNAASASYAGAFTIAEGPAWGGAVSGSAQIVGGALNLNLAAGLVGTYTALTVDLGAFVRATINGAIDSAATNASDLISQRGLVSSWESIAGNRVTGPTAEIWISTSQDGTTYEPAKRLTSGIFSLRYARVEVRLASTNTNHQISVAALTVQFRPPT